MTNTFEQIVSGLIVEGSPSFSVGKVYAEASRQATPTYKGRDVFKYLYNRTVASEQGKTKTLIPQHYYKLNFLST